MVGIFLKGFVLKGTVRAVSGEKSAEEFCRVGLVLLGVVQDKIVLEARIVMVDKETLR